MARFRVICPTDQKEKNNGSSKSNAGIMGKKLCGWRVGRVYDRQYQSKGFSFGFSSWTGSGTSSMG
jgi:hypothetical protein